MAGTWCKCCGFAAESSKCRLGDFVAAQIGGEPVVGDQVEWSGGTWTVALMDGKRIRKIGLKLPQGRPGPALLL